MKENKYKLKIDSEINIYQLVEFIDDFFRVGIKKECSTKNPQTGEYEDGWYYDYSMKDLIAKEEELGISKDNFRMLMREWFDTNCEIYQLYNLKVGDFGFDSSKYHRLKDKRKLLWDEIQQYIKTRSKQEQTKVELNTKKEFEDYLLCPNNLKKSIIDKIHIRYQANQKGRLTALILLALLKMNYIELPSRGRKERYEIMRERFGNIGTDQGIDNYIREHSTNITEEEKESMIEFLSEK